MSARSTRAAYVLARKVGHSAIIPKIWFTNARGASFLIFDRPNVSLDTPVRVASGLEREADSGRNRPESELWNRLICCDGSSTFSKSSKLIDFMIVRDDASGRSQLTRRQRGDRCRTSGLYGRARRRDSRQALVLVASEGGDVGRHERRIFAKTVIIALPRQRKRPDFPSRSCSRHELSPIISRGGGGSGRQAAARRSFMDQRLRLAIAAAVMLSGLGVALFFRHPSADTDLPIAVPSDSLVLRKQPDPRTFAAGESCLARHSPVRSSPRRSSRGAFRRRLSLRPISRPRRRNCPRAIRAAGHPVLRVRRPARGGALR